MVATTGAQLLPELAIKTMREQLLPLTTILTPNVPEARALLKDAGRDFPEIQGLDDLISLARALHQLGPQYILVKGGHLPLTKYRTVARAEEEHHLVVNVLYGGNDELEIFESDYVKSRNTHGTGCSLACAYNSATSLT